MKKLGKYLAIALASLAIVSSVNAQSSTPAPKTLDVKTGSTSLTLSEAFAGALKVVLPDETEASITLKKTIPGKIKVTGPKKAPVTTLTFPVVGGAVDTEDALGEVVHSGGVSFNLTVGAGSLVQTTKVSVTDLVINIPEGAATATASGLITVDGVFQGRVELFAFDFAASPVATPIEIKGNKPVVIKDAAVKLTQEGADALNAAFNAPNPIFSTDVAVGTGKITLIVDKKSL